MSRVTAIAEKALQINLDKSRYGTFAEIGAGQEVVRWFYRVGGAAGTIAKSMSAYDMVVSDAIYGECDRYVSKARLLSMLDYEQNLNLNRLRDQRGGKTAFFTFADTIQALSYAGGNECHGWMGIRFQTHPRDEDSQIILHVRMLDQENQAQQEAVGMLGVNLIYAALFLHYDPEQMVDSLLDGLNTERIEIDLVEFSGIEFRTVDNRIMSLRLVQLGLTPAAMFSANGSVLQPAEVLRKRPVIVERGRFRPVTLINLDMVATAQQQFLQKATETEADDVVTLMEMTMSNLLNEGDVDLTDFLSRADALAAVGQNVLISDYREYYRLAAYLSRYTDREIGIVMGAGNVRELFDETYYTALDGGILESFGRLFKNDIKVYVYPTLIDGKLVGIRDIKVPDSSRHLYEYLIARSSVVEIENYQQTLMTINSPDVLASIQSGDDDWEECVDLSVAQMIKERSLFGYNALSSRR